MSEPAQRSDVVLFNFIFGPSPYTMPTFPFFLQSAEYSGADIVFVGDTPPPMALPANIRHAPLGWSQLASRLEELLSEPGSPFRAAGMRDAARGTWNASEGERDHRGFKKACDLKPFFALLMPHIVAPYKWWGYVDNDLWLGRVGSFVNELPHSADVVRFAPTYSLGWFAVLRNTPYNNRLVIGDRVARFYARRILALPRVTQFDEWGEPDLGGLGYEASFGFTVENAKEARKVTVLDLSFKSYTSGDHYCKRPADALRAFNAQADAAAAALGLKRKVQATRLPPSASFGGGEMCAFCHLKYNARRRSVRLVDGDGQEKLACHWQHSKNTPEMAASIRVLQNSTSSTRRMPDLCGSFGRGFWRAKPKRSGDPCEFGSSRTKKIFG